VLEIPVPVDSAKIVEAPEIGGNPRVVVASSIER